MSAQRIMRLWIPRRRSVVFGLCFALVSAGVAFADVLVTVDGDEIETRGPWEVRGRQVIFTDAEGRHAAMRLSDIDLEASDTATRRAAAPPPPVAAAEPEAAAAAEAVLTLTNDNIGAGGDESAGGSSIGGITEPGTVRAALGVNAFGYRVKAWVNGVELPSITGGSSQAVQVFHVNHPQKAVMRETFEAQGEPEDQRKYFDLFCLREGSNELELEIEVDAENPSPSQLFHVYINAPAYSVPLLDFQDDGRESGRWSTSFEIYDTMPDGFTTITPPP